MKLDVFMDSYALYQANENVDSFVDCLKDMSLSDSERDTIYEHIAQVCEIAGLSEPDEIQHRRA